MRALNLHIEKRLRVIFTAVFIFCGVISAFAKKEKQHIKIDSSKVQLREPDKSSQEDYYNDDYYKYQTDKTGKKSEPGIFDRMLSKFIENLVDSMRFEKDNKFNWWSLFWIVLLIALVVLVVLKLTNSGVSSMFTGKRKQEEEIDATLEDVDIHSIDYEQQIRAAISNNDYRLAVRLWFLRTLKSFSDRELVFWKIDKTNSDYYYELSGTEYQKDFGEVSKVYDYIWYGEFPVDEHSYKNAEEKFRGLNGRIQ
jgi:hypothetical protein